MSNIEREKLMEEMIAYLCHIRGPEMATKAMELLDRINDELTREDYERKAA